ncbi:MAG TPA: MerR family transcriptional regulator [Acidimicrobiales bacterium]|nr:MerR family transcriptional regulator [Acidimicrobiales bacterium]
MITPSADQGISADGSEGIVAADAHGLAGISYRQLDHWARQGWVTPSVDPGEGRSGRRRYSADDVVRLDLLRHLAVSKVNPAAAGPLVARCDVPAGDVRFVWGPVGAKDADAIGLRVVPAGEALDAVTAAGAWVVYDPAAVRARMRGTVPPAVAAVASVGAEATSSERRSA